MSFKEKNSPFTENLFSYFFLIHLTVPRLLSYYDSNFLNSAKIQITDTTKATKSAMGAAYKIPFNPKNLGKIKTSGIKNNTCLVIDKNIPKYAFLMDAKKLDDNICTPSIHTSIR